MSAFKQKLARLGATAGVLAATTAAVMAVGGATAGSALAAPTCTETPGGTLKGEGSTLQKVAQVNLWTPTYNTACPSPDTHFEYTGTGSGAALNAFGFNGGAIKTEEAYVGTDEAPNSSAIGVAEGKAGVAPVVIPVAETSIAIVANKPEACKVTGGITWKDLNKLFAGTITKWSEISTITGTNKTACEAAETGAIKRVVRSDGSGTTYQFKNYLSELELGFGGVGPGKVETSPGVCTTETWAALRPNPTNNLLWPEEGCNTGVTKVERASGGGGVVNAVKATANTIGYAAYSDVFANTATANVLPQQNHESGAGVKTYAKPGKGTSEAEANCGSRQYTIPPTSTEGSGAGKDWSTVFGASPQIGSAYPLCTLTFDIGWNGYSSISGYAAGTGAAVNDYFTYVLNEGQSVLGAHGYQALPETEVMENNVLGAAKYALAAVK